MSTTATQKRRSRVERRSPSEVVEAVRDGKVSVSLADKWLRLSPAAQKAKLTRTLDESRVREARHRLVAATIRNYLDGLDGGRVDLNKLSETIHQALL